jgi:hypothetical protein
MFPPFDFIIFDSFPIVLGSTILRHDDRIYKTLNGDKLVLELY